MDERTRLKQLLLWHGYRYFTIAVPPHQPGGPLRYEVVIYADQRSTRRIATALGTCVEVLEALGHLPDLGGAVGRALL